MIPSLRILYKMLPMEVMTWGFGLGDVHHHFTFIPSICRLTVFIPFKLPTLYTAVSCVLFSYGATNSGKTHSIFGAEGWGACQVGSQLNVYDYVLYGILLALLSTTTLKAKNPPFTIAKLIFTHVRVKMQLSLKAFCPGLYVSFFDYQVCSTR